ncbi:MAG: PrsW family intramembrane metalloprotease [Bacteroidales bacterium]|nr:PrsW family intramembrane metalloprotease [Bacteroidales bacterium]
MSIILIASLLPVVLLMGYIYKRDTFQKEPWPMLMKAFGFGILAAFLDMLVASALNHIVPKLADTPFVDALYNAFVSAALPEEFCKLLMLYLCIWKNPYFDEYYDGLEYAAFVGLGFAGLENVLYILQGGLGLAFSRGIFAVPAHFFFAIFMGYFFAMARFRYSERRKFMTLAYIVPVLLHGTYDFVLMYMNNLNGDAETMQEVGPLSLALYVFFLVFFFIVWRAATKRVNRMSGQ